MAAALLRASLTGAVAVVIVWLMCRLIPRLSAATRATLWWCVAAKFVITLVWMAPVRVPILPAPLRPFQVMMTNLPRARGALVSRQDVYLIARNGIAKTAAIVEVRSAPADTVATAKSSSAWPTALLVVWGAGVLIAVGAGMRHWRRTRALVDRSPDAPEPVRLMTASLASRLKLSCTPMVKISDDIDTPLVIGLRHAVVLLPNQIFVRMSERQQAMSICHELAHIKRADLRLGCLPALAEALFFFHPFAKLAAREYALWREAACDAAVLAALDAAPNEYGRLLLDLGVAEPRSGALAATAASRSPAQLKRRLVMLSDAPAPSTTSRVLTAMAIGIALIALVPIQLVARSSPAAPSTWAAGRGVVIVQAPPPPAPAAHAPRVPDLRFEYLLFHDDQTVTWGRLSSVSYHSVRLPRTGLGEPTILEQEVQHAQQFKKPGEKIFWFMRDSHDYVIRDPALLREIDAIWKPVPPNSSLLAAKASEISGRRSVRDKSEAEAAGAKRDLDARMQQLDRQIAALTAQLHKSTGPADALAGRMDSVGSQLPQLAIAMQQAARPGEGDLLKILDRAIANGLATRILTAEERMPTLTGTVTTDKGAPDPNAAVFIYPATEEAWIDSGRSVRSARTNGAGVYTMRLQVGDYLALAVPLLPREAGRAWLKPDMFGRVQGAATRIHVVDGQTSLQLNLHTARK